MYHIPHFTTPLNSCCEIWICRGAAIEYIIRKHRSGDVEDVFCAELWVASAPRRKFYFVDAAPLSFSFEILHLAVVTPIGCA